MDHEEKDFEIISKETKPPETKEHKIWKSFYFGIGGAVLILLLGLVGIFSYRALYNLDTDSITLSFVKVIGLPAGFVGSSPISFVDFADDLTAVQKFYETNSQNGTVVPALGEIRKSVWDRLIKKAILEDLARSVKVVVEKKEVDDELAKLVKETGSEDKVKEMVQKTYGWSLEQFKKKIIEPYLLQNKLAANPDLSKALDEKLKKEAEDVLAKVKEGKQSFEDLAKEFSSDGSAAQGGDLGWFGKGMMVKEFEEATAKLQPGQVSELVKTQFGYHIIRLEEKKTEKGEDKWHARHILISRGDFDQYLDELVKKEKIWQWIKL